MFTSAAAATPKLIKRIAVTVTETGVLVLGFSQIACRKPRRAILPPPFIHKVARTA